MTIYYVATAADGGSASNPGTLASPWTLAKANTTLVSGDTAYLRGGTYSNVGYIVPTNSGTAGNRITYQNYNNESVIITSTTYAIYLNGKDYITVQGIDFYYCDQFMYLINGANYNVIGYCSFDTGRSQNWTGSTISTSSRYNRVHHCEFYRYGQCATPVGNSGTDQGTTLDIGDEESGSDLSQWNIIEDCIFSSAGHHLLGVFALYNTIRRTYFHNEAWSNGRGHRCAYLQGVTNNAGYCLFEDNRFAYTDYACNNNYASLFALTTPYNIIRFNEFTHPAANAISVASYAGQGSYTVPSYNKIYNNTFFRCGYDNTGGGEDSAIYFNYNLATGIQCKNNLYRLNDYPYYGTRTNHTFTNEYDDDTTGDPLFTLAPSTRPDDPTDQALLNFSLQVGSPAIGYGSALTTATSSGAGTSSLPVTNAGYFQDGTWAPPGVVSADWISVGTVGNIAQISSISGNTITLASPLTWNNGALVWLYKMSDGTRVLFGSAPEAGAQPFGTNAPIGTPVLSVR